MFYCVEKENQNKKEKLDVYFPAFDLFKTEEFFYIYEEYRSIKTINREFVIFL